MRRHQLIPPVKLQASPTEDDMMHPEKESGFPAPTWGSFLLRSLRNCSARFLDCLLPRQCLLCSGPALSSNACAWCAAELPRARLTCQRCALPIPDPCSRLCGSCLLRPPPWDAATAALVYRFPVDKLVCRFKFNRDFSCGRLLGLELTAALQRSGPVLPDLIAPVPLHRTRHILRTFNQADVLARIVGPALGVPVRSGLLSRIRKTRAQSGLDATDRRRNLRGAIQLNHRFERAVRGAHVALVDDVMTTGTTLAACTAVLRKAEAARVSVWVAARALDDC